MAKELVFQSKKGSRLFCHYQELDITSFSTDGDKEDIMSSLKRDFLDPDYRVRNRATMLYDLTKKFGIKKD